MRVSMKYLGLVLCGALLSLTGCADHTTQPEVIPGGQVSAPERPNMLSVPIPSGFVRIAGGTGVDVYRKNWSGGQPDFVTVIDLRKARLFNLTGPVSGAPNGSVTKRTMGEFWQMAVNRNTSSSKAIVVVNGTFFGTDANPTGIAFGLKSMGQIVHYGYGLHEYPGKTLVLPFDAPRAAASIQPHARWIFESGSPDVIGGLDTSADKGINSLVPRTFIGVRDDDRNGVAETVLLFSSKLATQPYASSVLTNFGASRVMMLDGGKTTGLIISGTAYIQAGRSMPHAIGVAAGR